MPHLWYIQYVWWSLKTGVCVCVLHSLKMMLLHNGLVTYLLQYTFKYSQLLIAQYY